MTDDEKADMFMTLVLTRTGLTRDRLWCPRAKSHMTPCLARDGHLARGTTVTGAPVCSGCETNLNKLLEREQE